MAANLTATLKPQQFAATIATPGPPGAPGPEGPPGAPGAPGPSSSVFYYKADAQSQAPNDPGSGKLRWNTNGQLDATSLYVDILTTDSFDVTTLFTMMHPPQEFVIQDKDLSQKFQTWKMTAPVIMSVDWFEVPVALVTSGGPGGGTFSNNTNLAVILISQVPQSPWTVNVDAAGYSLTSVGQLSVGSSNPPLYSVDVSGDINCDGRYLIDGAPMLAEVMQRIEILDREVAALRAEIAAMKGST